MKSSVTLSKEEIELILSTLENREFKYSKIKDLHSYFLHKLSELDDNLPEKKKEAPVKGAKLVPAVDMFTD